jgi:hypothetical protein
VMLDAAFDARADPLAGTGLLAVDHFAAGHIERRSCPQRGRLLSHP